MRRLFMFAAATVACTSSFCGASPDTDKITREFAKESGYPVFDLHETLAELGKRDGREKYTLKDGVHLTEEGNKVVAEGLFKALKGLIGKDAQ